ncbi:MAG: universal stress protein [Actinobacteria bacterium]|nr:universal stress protein [Actinomycetota bacterium]
MKNRPAVIIPLDGSKTATAALGAAQAMAMAMAAVLHIVYVSEEVMEEKELFETLKVDGLDVEDFTIRSITGATVVDAILKFAASVETEMIVMSSHGWTYNTQHLLGSNTMGVVQRAIDPVLVISPSITALPDSAWRPKKILVPQDGSPTSAAVIDRVFRLAELMSAGIDILNIGVLGTKPPSEAGTITVPRYLDYPRYDWPAWAREFVERFYKHLPPGVELRIFEREGDPADVMVKFASENGDDFVAFGWHGHLENDRALIVKNLIRKTDVPLMFIWSR